MTCAAFQQEQERASRVYGAAVPHILRAMIVLREDHPECRGAPDQGRLSVLLCEIEGRHLLPNIRRPNDGTCGLRLKQIISGLADATAIAHLNLAAAELEAVER